MKKRSVLFAVIKTAIVVVLLVAIIGVTGVMLYVNSLRKDLPNLDFFTYSPDQASQIFDYKGNLISNVYASENRVYVPLSEIADFAEKALIAHEDRRFYSHGAIDFRGLARAFFVTITSGGTRVEGASTLTQQLARTMFLTLERTIPRKIKEAILAYRIERRFTKDQILEMYLNQVYYGEGAYGIESAALTYFGKHAKDLTMAESALLIGILKAPSEINPFIDPESAKIAKEEVLAELLAENMISREEYDAAKAEELVYSREAPQKDNMGFVIDYVKDFVYQRFGGTLLYAGGLKIYTTVRPELQLAATKAIDTVLAKSEEDNVFPKGKTDSKGVIQPQSCLTAIDCKTGAILAMVGGRDYSNTKFNRTVSLKQPGSSFKIFDYTAAINYGAITPSTVILSEEFTIQNWTPHEWENKYFGYLPVREALNQSSNVAAVKTAINVGLERVVYTARKFGITTDLMPYPSMAIGSFEVKQLEMAAAYAALGNGGVYNEPYIVEKIISPDGRILYEHKDKSYRVVSEQVAYIMNKIFSYVMSNKPNARIKDLPSAGKTGSTDEWTDAWFEGYTPNISVNVWVGPDSKEVTFPGVMNSGARFPAMIWRQFMLEAMNQFPKDDFAKPDKGLVSANVINETGYLTSKSSDGKIVVNYSFLENFVPPYDIEDIGLVTVLVCKDSGLLAPPGCPQDLVEERVYLKGTEPKEYDPRSFQTARLSILLDKEVFKVGENIVIRVSVEGIVDLYDKKVSLFLNDLLLAKLETPSYGNVYEYSFTTGSSGSLNINALLTAQDGTVLGTARIDILVED